MNWYLLQTKPHAHVTACDHLRRQRFDVFLPLITKTTKKKALDITAPLFPGYLFIGTSIDPVPWKGINGTRGVSKAVTLDGVYRSVSADIIEGLQHGCDERGVFRSLNDIDLGDRAKIEKGPFSEFVCTVDQIKDDQRVGSHRSPAAADKNQVSLEDVSKIN